MGVPYPDVEVEIVLTVAKRRRAPARGAEDQNNAKRCVLWACPIVTHSLEETRLISIGLVHALLPQSFCALIGQLCSLLAAQPP